MRRKTLANFSGVLSVLFLAGLAAAPLRAQTPDAPQPMGAEADVNCFGYVGPENEEFAGSVVSGDAVYEQSAFSTQDVIYADNRGIRAGDDYWLLAPRDEVFDIPNGQPIGRFTQYIGKAHALCVKDQVAILEITSACTDVPIGTMLKPFEPIPVPLARRTPELTNCDEPSGKKVGTIVFSRDGIESLSDGTDVIIDIGADAGLSPGDFLTIFRYAIPHTFDIDFNGELRSYQAAIAPPRTVLGELAILTVGDRTATAQIISMSHAMEVGDLVEIK
ncbi:MAG TPA: hypothetical protein VKH46_08345 [Thermoanaerobaculia bacterium]|jgi:hypothetical protein|nr:hypothetical protein [Thermoanaerobaculia bacterium]